MKTLYITLILAFHITCGYAQTISPSLISNAGFTTYTEGIKVDWSLGEIAVQDFNSNIHLTQGFHQTFEVVTSLFHLANEPELRLFPNPTLGEITIDGNIDQLFKIDIYNLIGVHISSIENTERTIQLGSLHTGTYILHCHFKGGGFSIHKIVKI